MIELLSITHIIEESKITYRRIRVQGFHVLDIVSEKKKNERKKKQ